MEGAFDDQIVDRGVRADARIAGWDITLGETVADTASSGLYVLGDEVAMADLPELAAITMSMCENGTEVCTRGDRIAWAARRRRWHSRRTPPWSSGRPCGPVRWCCRGRWGLWSR